LAKDEETKKTILLSYFDDIIEKDVVERYKIRKKEKIKLLAKFYLSNISSTITFSSLEELLHMNSVTIEKFSSMLEESFLILFTKVLHPSVKKQEKVARKVYSIDVGISNAIGFRIEEIIGKLMENIVAIELKRRNSTRKFTIGKNMERPKGKKLILFLEKILTLKN
jgi:hypothetical protein